MAAAKVVWFLGLQSGIIGPTLGGMAELVGQTSGTALAAQFSFRSAGFLYTDALWHARVDESSVQSDDEPQQNAGAEPAEAFKGGKKGVAPCVISFCFLVRVLVLFLIRFPSG